MLTIIFRAAKTFLSGALAIVFLVSICAPLRAQVFATVPAISFTKPFAGADPLPQVLSIASVGAAFNFAATASTNSGGSWLSVSPSGCCVGTPSIITATVTTSPALAAGSYSGQVVVTSQNGSVSMTIPVSLTVTSAGTAFLDNLPGQMSFSLKTGNAFLTSQDVQVRNGGSGTLNWNLTTSTADGGGWLTASASSGTAPSIVTVGVNVANLPNGGLIAGTFVGQLQFQTANSVTTIPVSVVVGANILSQVNAINFVKVFAGANPLPQTLIIPSTGNTFINFDPKASTATGGNWLTVSNQGCCSSSPNTVTASVTASPTLAVGTYTGQIVVSTQSGSMSITIPVTLTVAAPGSTFFDNLPGQVGFSLVTGGTAITSQVLEIRNAGSGSLNWTLAASTSDASPWLTVSAPSGTAPSIVTVGVTVANLPNGGLVAGTFVGQLVFDSPSGRVTVPVSVVVGANILSQVSAINFTKVFGGANPLPQTLTIPSTGTFINFAASSSTATGGSWLSVSPLGCCESTPNTVTATVSASPTLAVGTYTGQIVISSQSGSSSFTVPVTLTVTAGNAPYFDNVPGQMSFSLKTASSNNPPAQVVQIRNAGPGSLDWTLETSTSDTGDWLHASATSGTAPSTVSITVQKSNLPGLGLVAGTFVGELVFRSSDHTNSVTVPVTVVVGDNILSQVNAINFVKVFGGANPLPQTLTIPSTGSAINFSPSASTATGGAWLTVTPLGCCVSSPNVIKVAVTASPTLAVGTYTGQIVVTTQSGSMAITIPVTLTVAPSSGTVFDDLPGQVSFFIPTAAGDPPTQDVRLRNAGLGTLNWSVETSTSDGGNWLTVSAPSGTAPSTVTVGVIANALPSGGLVAGTFVGELVFTGAGTRVTMPVSVVVGASIFVPQGALDFAKVYSAGSPLSQNVTIASTGTFINFSVDSAAANGGSWLSASPGGCCSTTPHAVTASVVAGPAFAGGTYTGQVVLTAQNGSMAMTIPVYLDVSVSLSTPMLLAPSNGAANASPVPRITWSASTNATSYDIYVDTSNPPSTLVASVTGTSYNPPVLNLNTTYFWQVVARNGSVTASSAVASFHTAPAAAPPISVGPPSGSAGRQVFTFVSRDLLGVSHIRYAQFLFSKSGINAINQCYISYDPTANAFYLLADDASTWFGVIGGTAATVGSGQCTVYGATSGSTKVGTDLTTHIDISFRTGFTGTKTISQFAADTSGVGSDWVQMGTWNDTGDTNVLELLSITPNSGTGLSQTFTAVIRDGAGATMIPFVQFVMNTTLNGFNGCYIHYDRASNTFFLLNDAGTQFFGLPAGSAGQVNNSQCTLHGTGSGGTPSGANLTVNYNLTFSGTFAGTKKVFMQVPDNFGVIENWHQIGTWTP